MKNKIFALALAATAVVAVSCEEDYKLYDTGQIDSVSFNYTNSNYSADSVITYNFGYDIAQEHEIAIPVTLMGVPKSEARKIDIKVVADSTDMVEGVNFTIARAEIAANATKDTVKIMLLRGHDDEIQTKEKKLRIEIGMNDQLRPTGQKTFTVRYSDFRITERPDWWSTYTGLPKYSFENAQLFFKYFYELMPKANKDVYNELITAYGEYFVKAKAMQGPFAMYESILTKYVLLPMYNDHKDDIEWQKTPSVN